MRTHLAASIVGSLVLFTAAAFARDDPAVAPPPPTETPPPQPPPPAPVAEAPPAPQPTRPEDEGHRGFYLRAAVGGGGLTDSFRSQLFLTSFNGKATGPSANFEVLAGVALKPGLILGGAFVAASVQSPKVTLEYAGTVPSDIKVGTLMVLGAAIVWYPKPAGAFRLEGVLGGARITVRDQNDNVKANEPVGFGGAFGLGYEWKLNEKWSLGLLGQGMFGSLTEGFNHHSVGCGALLVTLGFG